MDVYYFFQVSLIQGDISLQDQGISFKNEILPQLRKLLKSRGSKIHRPGFRTTVLILEDLRWFFPGITDTSLAKARKFMNELKPQKK